MKSATFERQMREGAVYARLEKRRRKLAYAMEGIEALRQLAPRRYLALSWGKQSIVLAHMLYQIEPQIEMHFLASSETWQMHNYAEVIEAFLTRWPINAYIHQTDRWKDADDWKESRDAGDKDLQTMCRRDDWDGWYWGLAKEESRARKLTLLRTWPGQPHRTLFRYSDDKFRSCPLADWDILDLAAYIGEHDIPLLDLYHRQGLEARTTARLTKKAATWGGLSALQHYDLSAFNKLCHRFPELRGVDRHQ